MRVSSQHVHSAFSHDGKLSVAQLADFCGQFIPLLPRIEYTCQPQGMHILGVGALAITAQNNPAPTGRLSREHGGWAVLAHPRRLGWESAPEVLREVEGRDLERGLRGQVSASVHAPGIFRKMNHIISDVAMEKELSQLTSQALLRNLREGA